MKDYNDIKHLVDRFFEGETSLDEEQKLYAFYSSHPQLPEELESYRDMFAGFDAISFENVPTQSFEENPTQSCGKKTPQPHHRRLLYVLSGIAATLLLCIGIFVAVDVHKDTVLGNNYGGSYMIVNGERIDDLSLIQPEIEKALSQAENIEQHVDEHSVIQDAQKNVLDNIADPKERARIQQLLNE